MAMAAEFSNTPLPELIQKLGTSADKGID